MWEVLNELTSLHWFVYIFYFISIVANILFFVVVAIGGCFDLTYLFRELRKEPDKIGEKVTTKDN